VLSQEADGADQFLGEAVDLLEGGGETTLLKL
jgi:hypothetical protein